MWWSRCVVDILILLNYSDCRYAWCDLCNKVYMPPCILLIYITILLNFLTFFSSGVGFGCSSGNNAGKKGSIKFAEKVMSVFFSWNCLRPILIQVDLDSHGREVEKYDRSKLRSWKKAKVRRNYLIPKKQLWCFQLESESDDFLISWGMSIELQCESNIFLIFCNGR